MKIARLALCTVLGLCASANATLILYEPFDYSTSPSDPDTNNSTLENNVLISTGEDWDRAGNAATPPPTVISGSLSTPAGVPAAVGNRITYGAPANGRSERLNFPAVNSGTVYYSLTFRATDLTTQVGTNTSGSYFAALNNGNNDAGTNTAPTVAVGKIQLRRDASQATDPNPTLFNIGVGNDGGAATSVFAPGQFSINTDIHVLVGYTFNPGAADDVTSMWINPDVSTFTPAETPDATVTGFDINASPGVTAFLARQVGGIPTLEVDELRIATDYQSALGIPEPGTLSLLAIAGLSTLRRRARR